MSGAEFVFLHAVRVWHAARGFKDVALRGVWGDRLPPMWTVAPNFVENVILQLKTDYFHLSI